jgi:hypothetical protein
MNALSDVAMIERIQMVEDELSRLRVDAYMRAGIPLPGQSSRMGRLIEVTAITFNVSVGALTGAIRGADGPGPLRRHVGGSRAVRLLDAGDRPRARQSRPHDGAQRHQARRGAARGRPDFREITDGLIAVFTPKVQEEAENAPSSH